MRYSYTEELAPEQTGFWKMNRPRTIKHGIKGHSGLCKNTLAETSQTENCWENAFTLSEGKQVCFSSFPRKKKSALKQEAKEPSSTTACFVKPLSLPLLCLALSVLFSSYRHKVRCWLKTSVKESISALLWRRKTEKWRRAKEHIFSMHTFRLSIWSKI